MCCLFVAGIAGGILCVVGGSDCASGCGSLLGLLWLLGLGLQNTLVQWRGSCLGAAGLLG